MKLTVRLQTFYAHEARKEWKVPYFQDSGEEGGKENSVYSFERLICDSYCPHSLDTRVLNEFYFLQFSTETVFLLFLFTVTCLLFEIVFPAFSFSFYFLSFLSFSNKTSSRKILDFWCLYKVAQLRYVETRKLSFCSFKLNDNENILQGY